MGVGWGRASISAMCHHRADATALAGGPEIPRVSFGGQGLGGRPEPGCERSGFPTRELVGRAWRIAAARDASGPHCVNTTLLSKSSYEKTSTLIPSPEW